MSIQDLGSIGELVAAFATIATLIYLAAQIRQNTTTVAASTYESVFTGYNDLNAVILSDPELARILETGLDDPQSLQEDEQFRFLLLMRSSSNQYLKLLRLTQRGVFPFAERHPLKRIGTAREIAQIYATPGGTLFKASSPNYSDLYDALAGISTEAVSPINFEQALNSLKRAADTEHAVEVAHSIRSDN